MTIATVNNRIDPARLVQVRDVYDKTYYVDREQLEGTATLLRVYRKHGLRAKCRLWGGSAREWQGLMLVRNNICPHDRKTWETHRMPDGSTYDSCPVCEHR